MFDNLSLFAQCEELCAEDFGSYHELLYKEEAEGENNPFHNFSETENLKVSEK